MSEILPQDVMYEILLLLPVESVGRFRCVSKAWRSLLSEPQFAKLHRNLNGPEDEIILSEFPPRHLVLSFISETHGVSRDMNLENAMVKGSCHGLVLLVENSNVVLKNPITLEAQQIPNSVVSRHWDDSFGLGYDSSKDDYKIVLIRSSSGAVWVFSVRNRIWRMHGNSVYTERSSPGMLLNSRLHWFRRGVRGHKNDDIASFNLVTDEFEEIPYPGGFQNSSRWKKQLIALGGCLAIVYEIVCLVYDVWLMKDYGVQDSWTRFTITPPEEYFRPLCSLGEDGIVLFRKHMSKFATYNRTSGAIEDMVINTKYHHSTSELAVGFSFRKSLVSPFFKIN